MKVQRTTNRRSFLRRVGTTATGSAALLLVGGSELRAQNSHYSGVTDCDTGTGADRPGFGVGVRTQYTDSDTGPSGDPRCHGRGSNSGADSGTQYYSGIQPYTGCSDRDYGPQGDPGGYGRSCRGSTYRRDNPEAPHVSGCSDNDPASGGDSIGNGRRCTPR